MFRSESQIIDYQTQQYRLFPGLATAYAHLFSSSSFIKMIYEFRRGSNNFEKINPNELAKVIHI